MNETHREARLKPEYAALYPGVGSGEWKPVGELIDTIRSSRLLGHRSSAEFLRGRLLDERHFEFRGQSPASATGPGGHSRVSD